MLAKFVFILTHIKFEKYQTVKLEKEDNTTTVRTEILHQGERGDRTIQESLVILQ